MYFGHSPDPVANVPRLDFFIGGIFQETSIGEADCPQYNTCAIQREDLLRVIDDSAAF
jgi:hypothetical protein